MILVIAVLAVVAAERPWQGAGNRDFRSWSDGFREVAKETAGTVAEVLDAAGRGLRAWARRLREETKLSTAGERTPPDEGVRVRRPRETEKAPVPAPDFVAGRVWRVRVSRVIDGDSFGARIGGRETEVRLAGIDTPEIHGDCAREKKLAQRARRRFEMLATPPLRLRIGDRRGRVRDRYGRLLGTLTNGAGVDVGHRLLREGLAERFPSGRPNPWCRGG